jgi:lysophospholipase L1-like esterase
MEQLQDVQQRRAATKPSHYVLLEGLVTVLIAILIFGGAELVVRIRQYHTFGPKSLHPMALRDQFTAFRLNPVYARVDRQHDAQGFRRGENVTLEKPPNTVRIFMIGGSTAYGATTDMPEYTGNHWRLLYDNQTIEYFLEQKLNQAFPSKHWEVINAAAPAYQLSQDLALIESVLLRYQPDCVILLDGNNDIDALWKHASKNYDPYAYVEGSEAFNLLANPGSFRSLLFFLAESTRENSAAFRLVQDRLRAIETQPRGGNQRKRQVHNPVRLSDLTPTEQARFITAQSQVGGYTHTVRQIQRILELDGVKAIFLLQPEVELSHKKLTDSEQRMLDFELTAPGRTYSFQQLFPEIAGRMRGIAGKDGFAFLSLTDAFDQTSDQTFSDDCHLTPEGNQIIAERLFPLVENIVALNTP